MSSWKIVVDFFLPPPLILTLLLILPMPRIVKQGLLSFAKNFLFLNVAGGIKLVHFMLLVTGITFIGAMVHTHKLRQDLDPTLTPNQRTAVLARIWREERNFWISALTFLLWGLLYRFYLLTMDHLSLQNKVKSLEAALRSAGGSGTEPSAPPLHGKVAGSKKPVHEAPGKVVEASAPPLEETRDSSKVIGKKKAA
mmetsp:Transcript_37039/g.82336  ORF Transcript_37039/g.82336 Transcript_37039/m.82336 type:complete len:196 (+) Transcript_37039:174-761(+)